MQKKQWMSVLGFLLVFAAVFSIKLPAVFAAPDLAIGSKIFKANCIGCHLGGKNSLVTPKTLFAEALTQNGMNSSEAIVNQVTKGKGAMPAFGAKLKPEEIESVAAFVLDQAQKGWAKG